MEKQVKKLAKKDSDASKKVVKKKTTKKKDDKVEVVTNYDTSIFEKKFRPGIHINFGTRLFFNIVFFVVFICACFVFASKTVEREKVIPIGYTDTNEVLYKVYLKPNNFYKEKYLGMNRAYVASLIDYIDVDFNYSFNMDRLTNIDFNYKIIGNLIIENTNGTKYIDEVYILQDSKYKKLEDSGSLSILESVKLDYNQFNTIANEFKTATGVEMVSYLNVYLEVDKKSAEGLGYTINDSSKTNIQIPLSERAIEINLTTNSGSITKYTSPKGNVRFNPLYLAIEIILFLISCAFLVKVISHAVSLIKVKTPYDKYIAKILKNYDRVIVETKNDLDVSNCKIIDVRDFSELLDVRDNLRLPIVYNNIVNHEKGVFYIKNNNDIYRLVIKNVDLQK